ncbi:hypothetical protein ACFSX9_09740 [Flavobacterium ardleyense]|uniref:Uncharacterized protein n=1 Tax=Flavobacterium ardleyense TaxID=2038737 RepID=A0ABW5Z814_9FLAO
MNITKQNFSELESEPSWLITKVLRLILTIFTFIMLVLFYSMPILFYMENYFDAIVALIFIPVYYLVLTLLIVKLIEHILKVKPTAIEYIIVDKIGVHYHRLDGEIESVFYKNLERSPLGIVYDIYPRTVALSTAPALLIVRINRLEHAINFRKTDLFYSYYTKNHRALLAHFIKGVKIFRPDLRISSSVYSEFCIDEKTMQFNKRLYWKTIAMVLVFLIIVIICIELYMKYRFGSSLLNPKE